MLTPTPKSYHRWMGNSIALAARSALAMTVLCSPLFLTTTAQAAPLPKDWCGRIWGVQGTGQVVWDKPTDGSQTTSNPPPTGGITMPTIPLAGGSYAALGVHADSGTLYTLDRNTGILYYYALTGNTWNSVDISTNNSGTNGNGVPPAITGINASTNINKMTITGNILYLADSNSKNLYSLSVNPVTGVPSVASMTKLSNIVFTGTTAPGNSTVNAGGIPFDWLSNSYIDFSNTVGTVWYLGGGDITNDEYGNTYNVTYDNHFRTTQNPDGTFSYSFLSSNPAGQSAQYAYFYKLNAAKTEWQYLGRAAKLVGNDQFAGIAFYADQLYLKGTAGQLFQVPLTGTNGNYSGWNTPLVLKGQSSIGTSDSASCGTPAMNVSKTKDVFLSDLVTPAPQQDRVGTGQYVKYTIVVENLGDAWARGTFFSDALPPGMTYLPNSATMSKLNTTTNTIETTNLNAATYPFTTDYVSTSPGSAAGEVRLPVNNNTNLVTFTYIARVDGTAPTIKNRATTRYTIPTNSTPPNCATGLNCGESPLQTLYPSIFGTVWNDTNGSAAGTFSNIFTTGESGTNTGTTNALYALLLDSTNKVLMSQPVGSDGKYSFTALDNNQSNLKVQLSTSTFAVGATPTAASIPAGWKATSPMIKPTINLVTTDIVNEDFGISLPAGVLLVKRITAINGQTINPNDTTKNLSIVVNSTATTNDDPDKKWPAGYLKGAVDGGSVKPGDTIEYTIYYLNNGSADAKKLKICDPIRGDHSYVPGSMKLLPGGTTDIPANQITLTDLATDTGVDRASRYLAGAAPTNCNAGTITTGADKGGVAIDLIGTGASNQPDLPALKGATAPGTPSTSYGWFRFQTQVNP